MPPLEHLVYGTLVYIEESGFEGDREIAKCFYLLPDGSRIDLIIAC